MFRMSRTLLFLPLLLMAACHPAVESRERHIVHRGEPALLATSHGDTVYVAVSKSQSYPVEKLVAEDKVAELEALVASGGAIKAAAGTPVKVLADSSDEREIEFTEGPAKGRRGWVTWEFLRSPDRADR